MKLRNLCAGLIALAVIAAVPLKAPAAQTQTIVLAGGCFWGMQGVFERLKGVTTTVGYAGGASATAHYEIVGTGETGHAESVQIVYDPSLISLQQLFSVYFFVAHDPTQVNRQGPDDGSQYRSSIFYTTPVQRDAAITFVNALTKRHAFGAPIATQIVPLRAFYPAEAYHQHYMDHNPDDPYIVYNDAPKVVALRSKYPQLLAKGSSGTAKT
jgi:peptide-methionine (S)-S-oxide reductase